MEPQGQGSRRSFLRAVLRKQGTHQQFFPMAAPVIEYNSPVAHRYILASLSLRAPPLCQPSETPVQRCLPHSTTSP